MLNSKMRTSSDKPFLKLTLSTPWVVLDETGVLQRKMARSLSCGFDVTFQLSFFLLCCSCSNSSVCAEMCNTS